MEENNKQLLIKDICARLPYGVYVKFKQYNEPLCLSVKDALAICNGGEIINDLQYLYLRPMSSMTEKEKTVFDNFCVVDEFVWKGNLEKGFPNQAIIMSDGIDWLLSHHFDFRGLIKKGLALEAPKDMY